LFANTDANWSIATSNDGYVYGKYSESFAANEKVDFADLKTKYIKFKVTLLSGLSASIDDEYAYIPSPGVPALTGLSISYSQPSKSYIYLTSEETTYSPQQIAVSVTANLADKSELKVGATTSNSYNWKEYYSLDQPASDRFGKIFIPIRERRIGLDAQGNPSEETQSNYDSLLESLDYVDGYVFRARYGKWDYSSEVKIFDADMNLIEEDGYKAYADLGLVVFKEKKDSLKISIQNKNYLTVGLEINNYNTESATTISGIGFMYNTNRYLPANLDAKAPEVRNIQISPSEPYLYDTISLTYEYFDSNMQKEDLNATEIRWYINNMHIDYLDNLRTWNNIGDFNDPIWLYGLEFSPSEVPSIQTAEQYAIEKNQSLIKTDDIIYATITVSDGKFASEKKSSKKITVTKFPPYISYLAIKGKDNNGKIVPDVNTSISAIADFGVFQENSPTDTLKSKIIWYVNGYEFKRGNLGEVQNGINNNEIANGETHNGILATRVGNVLTVTIIPATNGRVGKAITSSDVVVKNSAPKVYDVIITPNPRSPQRSNLILTYTYSDIESLVQDTNQYDRSTIKWFASRPNTTTFEEVTALANSKTVDTVNLTAGQKWYAEITPFDGLDVGAVVKSNVVTITA
jgi:hypothetical protein